MNRHAGPPRPPERPGPPEPTFAERARTLAHVGRNGTLATLSARHPGHPFASLMPYAADGLGRPLLLISSMAMHTQNLAADPRASLLVAAREAAEPRAEGEGELALARGRLTLVGAAAPVPAADADAGRAAYIARHPAAAHWADFDDFSLWRVEVQDIYFVGGFAAMGWVAAADYARAEPDPLADAAEGIMTHMNRDHADALLAYAAHFADEQAAEARMIAVDRLGFKLRLIDGRRRWSCRVGFPAEVRTSAEARQTLIAMLAATRAGRA